MQGGRGPTAAATTAAAAMDDFNVDEDGDLEAEEAMKDLEAWERRYGDDRSWEALQEDESGLLRPLDVTAQQREKRQRHLDAPAERIRRGMIRYMCLVVDLSRAAAEMDFRPNRAGVVAACVEAFVREFFDQNPLSHLALFVARDGVARQLTELSGSPEAHVRALRSSLDCSGDASLQNALEAVREALEQVPAYGHREALVVYSALSTCDPGDVFESVRRCRESRVRCSLVGLCAEMHICRHLCEETGGIYSVAMSQGHLRELIMEHAPPPPTLADNAAASLVRMGFPQRGAEGAAALCACHLALRLGGTYTCPRCRARVCELPTECHVCGLTLVSSPHLARSYHHLFPIPPFQEVALSGASAANLRAGVVAKRSGALVLKISKKGIEDPSLPQLCFGCQSTLPLPGEEGGGVRLECGRCKRHFCFDCDTYIHESLHNCPGCECLPSLPPPSSSDGQPQ
eukprot:jgi/Mesen1/1881/ME000143S00930